METIETDTKQVTEGAQLAIPANGDLLTVITGPVEVGGFWLDVGFKMFHLRLQEIRKMVLTGKTKKRGGIWQCDCGSLVAFDFYRVLDKTTQACGGDACKFSKAIKEKKKLAREKEKAKAVAPAPAAPMMAVEEFQEYIAGKEEPLSITVPSTAAPSELLVEGIKHQPELPMPQKGDPAAFSLENVKEGTPTPEQLATAFESPFAPKVNKDPAVFSLLEVKMACNQIAGYFASLKQYDAKNVLVIFEWDVTRQEWLAYACHKNQKDSAYSAWGKTVEHSLEELAGYLKDQANQALRLAKGRVQDLAWAE